MTENSKKKLFGRVNLRHIVCNVILNLISFKLQNRPQITSKMDNVCIYEEKIDCGSFNILDTTHNCPHIDLIKCEFAINACIQTFIT